MLRIMHTTRESEKYAGGYRDGSVVKSMYFTFRRPEFNFQQLYQVAHNGL